MPTGTTTPADALAVDDPRLDSEFWRAVPPNGSRGAVLLVGVVHGHPASSYRVRTAVETFDPDVVGLELPSVAVPAFERAARDADDPDEMGEMRTAIDAASGSEVVGIDTLGPGFVGRLAANAIVDRAPPSTVRRTARNVGYVLGDAVARRLDPGDEEWPTPVDPDVEATDAPAVQASDERAEVARSKSLLGAIERPRADRLLDRTREGTMTANIEALRRRGSVVAVVGMDHLDAIASDLS